MVTITKMDPMSWAKFQAIFSMIGMLVIGILQMVLISSLGSMINSVGGEVSLKIGPLAGMGALGLLIGVPVAGVIGFVVGLVGAWVSNLVLKLVGGVKLEMTNS